MSKTKSIALLVCGLCIAALVGMKFYLHRHEITIVKKEWRGVSCTDPSMKMVGGLKTETTLCLMRIDGDDSRIYKIFPASWTTTNHLHLPGTATKWEWKLPDDSPVDTAIVVAQFKKS